MEKMGPLKKDHPVLKKECSACHKLFNEGDFVTLIPLGPGDDPESQEKAQQGKSYHAEVAAIVHFSCAGGE